MEKFKGFILIIAALVISVNGFTQNRSGFNCIAKIESLSDLQKQQINKLDSDHQTKMNALRTERQTSLVDQKGIVYRKMQVQKDKHRAAVLELLNDAQKNQYLALQDGKGKRMKNNPKGRSSSGKSGKTMQRSSKKQGAVSGNCNGMGQSRPGNRKGKNRIS